MSPIVTRYSGNPVLKPSDMPLEECSAVYNGGAIKHNGEYIMLLRTEDAAKKIFVYSARSRDGYHFTPEPEPLKFIADDMEKYKKYTDNSFYDPRINIVEGKFYISYAAYTFKYGCRIGLGVTEDFKTVKHVSFPHHVQNRNAVIFPEKFDGYYVMLHRAENTGGGHMWISRSKDLEFWGDAEIVADKGSGRWDAIKIGAGSPPVKTAKGWLVITHAVTSSCAGHYYTAGAMLFDLKNPYKLIAHSRGAIMRPEASYETNGFVPNVVFPTSAILEDDGMLKIYYGAADNYECLAEAKLDDILNFCDRV